MRNWSDYPDSRTFGRLVIGLVGLGGFVRDVWVSGGDHACRDDAGNVGRAHPFSYH